MSPQLTLQTPLELAPADVPTYLERLVSEQQGSTGSARQHLLPVDLATRLDRTTADPHRTPGGTDHRTADRIACGGWPTGRDRCTAALQHPLAEAVVGAITAMEGTTAVMTGAVSTSTPPTVHSSPAGRSHRANDRH